MSEHLHWHRRRSSWEAAEAQLPRCRRQARPRSSSIRRTTTTSTARPPRPSTASAGIGPPARNPGPLQAEPVHQPAHLTDKRRESTCAHTRLHESQLGDRPGTQQMFVVDGMTEARPQVRVAVGGRSRTVRRSQSVMRVYGWFRCDLHGSRKYEPHYSFRTDGEYEFHWRTAQGGGSSMAETLTVGQPSPRGLVTGYVLKIIREGCGLTQSDFADRFGLDRTTIQGWESGRRPLPGRRVSDAVGLRYGLIRLGANARLLRALDTATEADYILGHLATSPPEAPDDLVTHPLGAWVYPRELCEMIAWALRGDEPEVMRLAALRAPARRGPVPASPAMDLGDRRRAFVSTRRR